MSDNLGAWVARFAILQDGTLGARLTQWHLVQSDIAGREITKCGRQLGTRDGTEVWPQANVPDAAVLGDDRCKYCL